MKRAEAVLEYSIRKHTTAEVEFVWMRSGDPGWDDEWNRGRAQGHPYSGIGWATDFTCFRFAVPHLMDYRGRAIYLDADMLVLGDIRELFEMMTTKAATLVSHRWDVIVWDCEKAEPHLPPLRTLQENAHITNLRRSVGLDAEFDRDPMWDVCDRVKPGMKLLHFTNMRTQPWHPWPDRFNYPKTHPIEEVQQLWEKYEREARSHHMHS